MKSTSQLLLCVRPLPWLCLAVAAATLGHALFIALLEQLSCKTEVPADAPAPWWVYTALFVVFCAAQTSTWLPLLAVAPLLKPPTGKLAYAATFVALFVSLTTLFALWDSHRYITTYGGSWASDALRELPGSAQISFWFAVAAAAVNLVTQTLIRRRT